MQNMYASSCTVPPSAVKHRGVEGSPASRCFNATTVNPPLPGRPAAGGGAGSESGAVGAVPGCA